MEQKEIITALHAQLKAAAQRIFAALEIKPGKYTPAEVDKALNLSGLMSEIASARYETRQYPATKEVNEIKINNVLEKLESVGISNKLVTISIDTFTASMPEALVFAKLVQWEKEFKIKSADKITFIKEEEGEVIASCIVEFPKEAKYIAEYAATDQIRPLLMGVLLDTVNGCIVATDTHVLTEMSVTVSDITGDPMRIIIDPKIIKAVAGQRCTVKLLKDVDNNISIKTDKGDVYTCANIEGNYPAYRRVYPKVNRDGLIELTKEGIKTLSNFAKATVKQTKDTRGGDVCIKIEIPAYSSTGKATYFDPVYQSERIVNFAIKGSPKIDIVFGVQAFSLAIVTKNWNGCLWFTDPSRPIVFDNINTACTIIMPRLLLDNSACGCLAGVVEALKRHDYTVAEAEEKTRKEEIKAVSAAISRPEKEECAKRYISIKGSGYKFEELTDKDEIIATTPNGCRARYIGTFRRSGELVLFECKENHISIPEIKQEPKTPDYADLISSLINLLDVLNSTTTVINQEMDNYYQITVINPLRVSLDVVSSLGTILLMCAKALEIEELAKGINIELESISVSIAEPKLIQPKPTPTETPPLQPPELEIRPDAPPLEPKPVNGCDTAPPGCYSVANIDLNYISFGPPGQVIFNHGPPLLIIHL